MSQSDEISSSNRGQTTLILGGARAGKSLYAQELAAQSGKAVLFVATATAGDDDMRRRIETHRRSRPASWSTVEQPIDIGTRIRRYLERNQVVIVDCVTMLVSNIFAQYGGSSDSETLERAVSTEIEGLIDCICGCRADFLIVSNEVGLGIVPADPATRLYRDLLGKANQALAQHADEVVLMVAGIPVRVKGQK